MNSALSATRLLVRAAALGAVGLALTGCSTLDSLNPFGGEKYEQKILPDEPAETIYNQGLARLSKADGESAAKRFAALDRQYPQSDWAKKGLLMETYSFYQAAKYDDAIASANRYVNRFPTDKDAPYALYLGAMSYYQQVPDISRDQERAGKALALFELLVEKYPKSEYVDDAKYKIQVTKDQLAGKEMSVGRYYQKNQQYIGAINRYRVVIERYQTTTHVPEALHRLVESYLSLGVKSEAKEAAAVLGYNFPGSEWYQDSYFLMTGEGTRPPDEQGGWFSGIF